MSSYTIELNNRNSNMSKSIDLIIYDGFKTKDDLLEWVFDKSLPIEHLVVIKFLDMFYGVCFESFEKEIIIGKTQTWVYNGSKMNVYVSKDFHSEIKIDGLKKKKFYSQGIYTNLLSIDRSIEIINNDRDISKYEYAKSYVILLGLTFFTSDTAYFKRDELELLSTYFINYGYFHKIFNKKTVVSINPFLSLVRTENGYFNYRFN